jgi:hypothetical protein
MAHMLGVSTGQIRDPIPQVILMKSDNGLMHTFSCSGAMIRVTPPSLLCGRQDANSKERIGHHPQMRGNVVLVATRYMASRTYEDDPRCMVLGGSYLNWPPWEIITGLSWEAFFPFSPPIDTTRICLLWCPPYEGRDRLQAVLTA